jgi:hypothetical protein
MAMQRCEVRAAPPRGKVWSSGRTGFSLCMCAAVGDGNSIPDVKSDGASGVAI